MSLMPPRTTAPVTDLAVDDRGLLLAVAADVAANVLFDDQRVFSFWLERDTVVEGDRRHYPWPPALRRFLDGAVEVSLADPVDGTVWLSTAARLGGGEGAITVQDRQGNALALDKSMRLTRLFGDRDPDQMLPLLDTIDVVLGALEAAGVEPFVAYGTLLGAVRDQDFIGHDSDADLGYVSRFEHPVDVIRESFQLQRRLRDMGFPVQRYSGLGLKVVAREADGQPRGLDVFGGFMRDDVLYLMGEVGHRFRKEWLYPRSTVVLAGRELPAPAEPAHLLEAMYGPTWQTPDPAYKFTTPRSTQRRLSGWFRGTRVGFDERWARRRADQAERLHPGPSPFVRWVRQEDPDAATYVDIGCGEGADALWLSRYDAQVVGLDFFAPDLRRAERRAERRGRTARFEWMNLHEMRSVLAVGAWLAREPGPRVALAHHVVDATDREGLAQLLRLARMVTRGSGRCYLQFQTVATPHSKSLGLRAVPHERVAEAVRARGGTVERLVELSEEQAGTPGAVADATPTLCRMVVSWSR
jgi:SAM-dependent methyltransferase